VKGKLKLILPVILLLAIGGGAAYWFVLAPPAKAKKAVKPKVNGSLFALSPEFVVNLTDGHYGKVTVALLLAADPTAKDLNPNATTPTLVEDPVIRATITNDLTGIPSTTLIQRRPRQRLLAQILHDLHHASDEQIRAVMFTDVVVQ
jgi:flagellar basal body-associated protein FliL